MQVTSVLLVVATLVRGPAPQSPSGQQGQAPNYSFSAVTPQAMEWNKLTWGMTLPQVERLLAKIPGVDSHKLPANKDDYRARVSWRARIHGAEFYVMLGFYGPDETLQTIKLFADAAKMPSDISGEVREREKSELLAAARKIVAELDQQLPREADKRFGDHFDAEGAGVYLTTWVTPHTVAELWHIVYTPTAKSTDAANLRVTLWSRPRAEAQDVHIPKLRVTDAIADQGFSIPAGSRSIAQLDKGPDERGKDFPWDAIVIINQPFVDAGGERHGPEKIRLLVKIDPTAGRATAFEADWFRPESDGAKSVMLRGKCSATVGLVVESDGSLMRSKNRSVEVVLTSDLKLKPWDFLADIFLSLQARAQAGDAEAMVQVGFHYSLGIGGCRRDKAMAMDWYSKAAKLGSESAMLSLAEVYVEDGETGVAKQWYERAAAIGSAKAHHALAMMYYRGADKDPDMVLTHLQEAAIRGNGPSMAVLSSLYGRGDGCPKDRVASYAWAIVAAAAMPKDEKASKLRDAVEELLEPQDRRIAEELGSQIRALVAEQGSSKQPIAKDRLPTRVFRR